MNVVIFGGTQVIQPLDGIKSKTPSYRIIYSVMKPFMPVLQFLFPNNVTTTRRLGRAMIQVAQNGYPKRVLEMKDINQV